MKLIHTEYNGYLVTTDKNLLQPEAIHKWLSEKAYWCKQIPYDTVKTAFDNSYTIGILKGGKQIAYARFITDYAVFAYLADVYVEEEHRGVGLGKKMVELMIEQDWVKGLRKVMLGTLDAKELYRKYGFTEPKYPDRIMEITRPAVYGDHQNKCK